MSGNKIIDLPSLYLRSIRHLNLNFNAIASLQDFDGNSTLEILELNGNKIKSLKGLAKAKNLKELHLE